MKKRLVLLLTILLVSAGCQQTREYEKQIEENRPTEYHPMTFGMYVDAASYLYIREHTEEYIIEEIELYDELPVDLLRIDCRHDLYLENDTENIKKLEKAIKKIRETDKKLMLGAYGVEKWFQEPRNWDEWKNMYRNQVDTLMEEYQPEYMYILPETPTALGRQIKENITDKEWINFIEETATRIKDKKPDTKIVVGFALHHPKNPPIYEQLIERDNNIDAVGNNPYSIEEMENTANYLEDIRKSNKEMWITETWSNGNIEYEKTRSAKHIKYAVYYAQKNKLDGFILFGGSWSMHKDKRFEKLDTYNAYKNVIEEIHKARNQ